MAAGLFLLIDLSLQGRRLWSLNATYDQGLFFAGDLERPAAWIVSQPGFNAAYAPAFRGNGAWVHRSQVKIQALLASGDYRVHRCDQRGIVLRHVSAVTDPKGEPSAEAGASCVRQQFEKARAQMQREGDASKR
jgi:hypothetical protein